MCVCVCVCVSTDLLPGARHADAVLHGDFGCRVSTWSRVLSEAQIIIGAQVNHIVHHPTRVAAGEEEEEIIRERKRSIDERKLMILN